MSEANKTKEEKMIGWKTVRIIVFAVWSLSVFIGGYYSRKVDQTPVIVLPESSWSNWSEKREEPENPISVLEF